MSVCEKGDIVSEKDKGGGESMASLDGVIMEGLLNEVTFPLLLRD